MLSAARTHDGVSAPDRQEGLCGSVLLRSLLLLTDCVHVWEAREWTRESETIIRAEGETVWSQHSVILLINGLN